MNQHFISPNKAVFLDRDGTIIKDTGYLTDPDQIEWESEDIIQGLQQLLKHGFLLIIITNQSGIGRGLIRYSQFFATQSRLLSLLEDHHIKIHDYFFCPHHPATPCLCRKPNPGLIFKAIKKHHIQPEHSFFVGDKVIDYEAGKNAGLRSFIVLNDRDPASIPNIHTVNPLAIMNDFQSIVNQCIAPQ